MPRYGRRGLGTGDRLYRAGSALSDFGELLGQYAYMQMQMKNIQDDNARRDAQLELDKKGQQLQAGLSLIPGMRDTGASLNDQNRVSQMIGMEPDLSQGPTLQTIPGIETPEQRAMRIEDESYSSAYAKTTAENLLPRGVSPDIARSTLMREKEESAGRLAEKQGMGYAKAEVWKQEKLHAQNLNFMNKAADDIGLTGEDRARFVVKGDLPDRLKDKDLLDLAMKYQAYSGVLSSVLGTIIDTNSMNLSREASTLSKDEFEKRQATINQMQNTKLQLDQGNIEAIPGATGVIDLLVERGLYKKAFGEGENSTNDAERAEALKRKLDSINQQLNSYSPTQSALGGGY